MLANNSTETIVKRLRETQQALYRVDAMVTMFGQWDLDQADPDHDLFLLANYSETMRDLLGPTYESLDDAIRHLETSASG